MSYKVSLDGKTIIDVPVNVPLFTFILDNAPRKAEVIKDTFTVFDLKNGVSKKLIVSTGRRSYHVFAGVELTTDDLTAQYDSFGTIIK